MPEDNLEYECFAIIFIDLSLIYKNNYYLKVYLDNRAFKTVGSQMTGRLYDNLFETDED